MNNQSAIWSLLPGRGKRLVAVFALLGAFIAVSGQFSTALAREKLPAMIQFSIQDDNGSFFYEGEIEFCTPDGECLFADIDPGFPGHFWLPRKELKPGVPYTVFVYDPQVTVLFEMRGWTFNPEDFDPGYNTYWELDQFLIFPHFKAHPDRKLTFHLDTTLNPEWKVVSGLGFADDDYDNLPDWPEFMLGLHVPFMLGGKFTSDENAAGGVKDVDPGFGLSGTWRTKYPRIVPERDKSITYREVTLSYSQNRYETLGVYYPGRNSDVTFHRLVGSYGFGFMDQEMSNHWSVAGALAFGGIYDGSSTLRYLGQKYTTVGVGVQARVTHELYDTERLKIGLTGHLEWMIYSGGEERGFWYGSAPAGMLGLTFY